ncbi:MAG: zonular occludens toxin domain-containing protein, partial [Nanoarchaeota archaeon]|nr:zonular occludens toxin domain-containing protein [Nanoarchaeota archaeon]
SSEYKKILDKKESLEYSMSDEIKRQVDKEIDFVISKLQTHKYRKNFLDNIGNYDNYLKASGLLDELGGSLIVWDECQNDLEENDPIWIRFFSYHRHFEIDMILITQDLSLIHRKYKAFMDKFYFGQNAAKRFMSKTLRYKVYCDSKEYKKFYIETISLKMVKEIHDFYDSGSYEVGKSQLKKLLFIPVVIIIALYIGVSKFLEPPEQSKQDTNTTVAAAAPSSQNIQNNQQMQEQTENEEIEKFKEDNVIIELSCNNKYCFIFNSRFNIPTAAINAFVAGYDGEILYKNSVSKSIQTIFVSIPQNRYEDLAKFEIKSSKDEFGGGKYKKEDSFSETLNPKKEVNNHATNQKNNNIAPVPAFPSK